MCWNFPNLNAIDQVAQDQKTVNGLPILPFLKENCCSFLFVTVPPPTLPPAPLSSFLPLAPQSVGAGMPPCSPQSCHGEQFQMFLKPAQACAGVKWEGEGGEVGEYWRTTYTQGLTQHQSYTSSSGSTSSQYPLFFFLC